MEDQLISFETAKLAKEKGFDEDVQFMYGQQDNPQLENFDAGMYAMWELTKAPTQSLLQKWLREKYDIDVSISRNGNDFIEHVRKNNLKICLYNWSVSKNGNTVDFGGSNDIYEEALENGLQEALKLI